MTLTLNSLFFIFLSGLIGCQGNDKTISQVPLIAKDTTKKLEKTNNLIVFVGKKITLKDLPYKEGSLDNGFMAKYEILLRVYGYYQSDTIQFIAYDHYGTPPFSKFENVLLYLVKYNQQFHHVKYMYNDVYKTKDGRWAGRYAYNDYEHPGNENTPVKPAKLNFEEDIYYPINKDDYNQGIKYPEPYFKIEGKYAKVIYGNYLEDLFTLKKNGVLSYEGYFGDTIPNYKPIEVQDVILEEITPDSKNHK